jgi:hypothetical protein
MVLAGLVASPLSVSAQAASEDSLSSWQVEAKPAPEEPALQLKLDDAGVAVVRSPPPAIDGYPRRIQIIDEPRSRGAKAGIAVGVILGAFIVGSVIAGAVVLQF